MRERLLSNSLKFRVREYDSAWKMLFYSIQQSFHELDPLLSKVPGTTTRHRGPIRNISGPEPLDQGRIAAEAKSILATDDIRSFNVESHSVFIHELASGIVHAIASGLIQSISDVTDRTGNVMDAQGGPPTPDLILDLLEKMSISFDDEGNPQMPTLYAHPEMVDRLLETPYTEEHERRRQAILARKKEEFFAKKRTRRLR